MGRNLIRPDGSVLRVESDDEAQKLQSLGYREETPASTLERQVQEAQDAHYSTLDQRALTVLEGGVSGLTLGASDLLLDGEGTRERARVNPGTRLASEIVGGLLPLAPGALGTALRMTPAGALARGATATGELVGRGSKTISALTAGAVEGAGVGLGQAVTTAQLSGDPITAESIMAGMGWGAIFGGGLSAIGSGIASKFEARAARAAAREEAAIKSATSKERAELIRAKNEAVSTSLRRWEHEGTNAATGALEDGAYARFHGAMDDVTRTLKEWQAPVDEMMQKPIDFTGLGMSQKKIYSSLVDKHNLIYVRPEAREYRKHFAIAQQAAKDGQFDKMVKHLDKFKDQMVTIETKLGGKAMFDSSKVVEQANSLMGLAKYRIDNATMAAEDAVNMTAVRETLSGFPRTTEEFVGMGQKRVEQMAAAIDKVGKLKAAELAGIKEAVADAVTQMSEGLGVKMEGTPGTQLAGLWKMLKDSRTKAGKTALREAKEGNLLWDKVDDASRGVDKARLEAMNESGNLGTKKAPWLVKRAVGAWAAQKAGGGTAGIGAYALGSSLVGGLVSMKGAVLGTINAKVNKWMPKVGRGIQKVGPRVDPFATRIDGTLDDQEDSRRDKMMRRIKEISNAAPAVRDTLYRSIQPLAMKHPELAARMHAHGVARFQFLLSKMPKDPGLAYSALKSLWKPDDIAMEKFGRYYEVFQNPVAVMNRALETGKITMEAAEALREMDPELFSYLRAGMLNRVADPEIRDNLKYDDQVHLGLMLGMSFHSTMDPRFVSAQQQMYTERNQPLEMNPRIQPGGGAGRPSGPGPSATAGQKITEH